MAVIFVTGGTGFVGSHFLKAASEAGHEVRALKRAHSRPRIPLSIMPTWIEAEHMSDVASNALENCDTLVHLASAGVTKEETWQNLFRINVIESLLLWIKASEAGIKRFIICGSCFEYGRSAERFEFVPPDAPLEPETAYAASKAAATMAALAFAKEKQLEVLILRPFHVFGEGEASSRFWPALRAAALSGLDFPMTLGGQIRDFVPVHKVVADLMAAITRPNVNSGQPIVENLGSGEPQTLAQFAESWWRHFGATGELKFGGIPYRKNEVMRYVPEISHSSRSNR